MTYLRVRLEPLIADEIGRDWGPYHLVDHQEKTVDGLIVYGTSCEELIEADLPDTKRPRVEVTDKTTMYAWVCARCVNARSAARVTG